jgi:hypothetical protein
MGIEPLSIKTNWEFAEMPAYFTVGDALFSIKRGL